MTIIDYKPSKTIREFIKDYRPGELFYDWVVGPYGSSKTTGLFFKLVYMAGLQAPGPDGIRKSRAVIIRNTAPQLRDTTIASWNYFFKDGEAGKWSATDKKFILRFNDVECEVLFRPLDSPDDVARVLSLEVTFAIIDEFVEIPREIVDALSGRVGRYPSKFQGGATNYGVFGASNPSTEDNWWYDYLHTNLPENARYFHQPSGLSPEAENLENLPPNYYRDIAKGKSEAWIAQYIEAFWGYSTSGQAVMPTFKAELHVAKKPLIFNPALPLVVGLDPGLEGSAMVLGQEDLDGRLLILAELVQQGMGADRLISERLKPLLRNKFPDAEVIIAPDPAAFNRTQTDEKTVVDKFKKFWTVKGESNNRLPLRLDAYEYYTCRLIEGRPAFQVDPSCVHLIRALKGGWRFAADSKHETLKSPTPEKNAHSHVGDAGGYISRFFHRQNERFVRNSVPDASGRVFRPPMTWGARGYHAR